METSREELGQSIARRRYWAEIGLHREPKPPAGETVEEAIARGCSYTIIESPRIAEYKAPDFVPAAPKPKRKAAHTNRWPSAPGREFCLASQRYTEEEFERASQGPRNFRPHTLAAIRLVAVEGESFAAAAAEAGIQTFDLRQRFAKFNERALRK